MVQSLSKNSFSCFNCTNLTIINIYNTSQITVTIKPFLRFVWLPHMQLTHHPFYNQSHAHTNKYLLYGFIVDL